MSNRFKATITGVCASVSRTGTDATGIVSSVVGKKISATVEIFLDQNSFEEVLVITPKGGTLNGHRSGTPITLTKKDLT